MSIDTTELQNQVIEHWENEGVKYFEHETQTGASVPPGGFTESVIKTQYQEILDDPMACLEELGYESFSQYVKDQTDNEPMQGVEMGYSRISKYSTKFFYQFAGQDLEFYIERDPNTNIAKLWLNPGATEATNVFISAIKAEQKRAERVAKM